MFFSVPANAAEQKKNSGPIDAGALAQTIINNAMTQSEERMKATTSGQTITKDTNLMDEVMSANSWIITRAIVYGVSGMQEARKLLEKEDTLLAMCRGNQGAMSIIKGISEKGEKESREQWLARAEEEIRKNIRKSRDAFSGSTKESGETNNEVAKKVTSVLKLSQGLAEIAKFQTMLPGGSANGENSSLFKTIKLFAIWLLFVGATARITWIAWQMFTNQTTTGPSDMATTFIKMTMLLILMQFIDKIAFFGIEMSDMVKDALVTPDENSKKTLFSVIWDLFDAKFAMLSLSHSTSIWDVFQKPAGELVAKVLAWGAFYVAAATMYVLMLLADMTMALTMVTAPFVMCMSLFPTCEKWMTDWVKNYVQLLFWGPLIAVYAIFFLIILSTGYDTSYISFIIVMLAYVLGAGQIPSIARSMGGASLAGAASSISAMPGRFIMGAGMLGIGGLLGAAGKMAGGSKGGEKRNAVNAK